MKIDLFFISKITTSGNEMDGLIFFFYFNTLVINNTKLKVKGFVCK